MTFGILQLNAVPFYFTSVAKSAIGSHIVINSPSQGFHAHLLQGVKSYSEISLSLQQVLETHDIYASLSVRHHGMSEGVGV